MAFPPSRELTSHTCDTPNRVSVLHRSHRMLCTLPCQPLKSSCQWCQASLAGGSWVGATNTVTSDETCMGRLGNPEFPLPYRWVTVTNREIWGKRRANRIFCSSWNCCICTYSPETHAWCGRLLSVRSLQNIISHMKGHPSCRWVHQGRSTQVEAKLFNCRAALAVT